MTEGHAMNRMKFYFDTVLHCTQPINQHDFLLRCIPQELPEQRVLEMKLDISPHPTGGGFGMDSFGNRTYSGRIPEAHDDFRYTISGRVERNDKRRSPGMPLPCYRYPSSLTAWSSDFDNFLLPLREELAGKNPLEMAEIFRRAIYRRFIYTPGATNVSTTAAEALSLGKGVCQDYTHVFLTFCRHFGIPARYVSGLPEGEGASHAWGEIWYKGIWYGIDPTRNCDVDERYLKLCTGRDFRDCPIERGVFWGCGSQMQTVFMKVTSE